MVMFKQLLFPCLYFTQITRKCYHYKQQPTFLRTLSSHVTVVSFHDLPTDVMTKMHSEYRMQYGYGDIIYVRHRFYSADPRGRAV